MVQHVDPQQKPTMLPAGEVVVQISKTPEKECEGLTTRCLPEYTEELLSAGKLTGMVEIAAPEIEVAEGAKRKPVEICAVIDRSGSMRVQKLGLVLKSLEFIVRELTAEDKLSVISFDQTVKRELAMTAMTPANKICAQDTLARIQPGGSTNLSGGLLAGVSETMKNASTSATKAVWLFTDGEANVGLRHTPEILHAVNSMLGESTALTISTFGFGASHNEDLLRSIAETGSGMYYFLKEPADISPCFAECLGGLLTVAATDITVTFVPAKGVSVVKAHGPKATADAKRSSAPQTDTTFSYTDIYSGEKRNILLTLQVDSVDEPSRQTLGLASVTWKDLAGAPRAVSVSMQVDRVKEYVCRIQESDVEVQVQRVGALEAITLAKEKADTGKYEDARAIVAAAKCQVEEAAASDQLLTDLVDELEEANECMTFSAWASGGRKKVTRCERGHEQQRACKGFGVSAYSNAGQKMMKSKMAAFFK